MSKAWVRRSDGSSSVESVRGSSEGTKMGKRMSDLANNNMLSACSISPIPPIDVRSSDTTLPGSTTRLSQHRLAVFLTERSESQLLTHQLPT